jgi:transposase
MLQITPLSRILAAVKPVDFRKGIDSLAGFCLNQLAQDPLSGTIFLFRNRANNAIRALVYDGQGFWLCTKRLSKGRFYWWPTGSETTIKVDCKELQTLMWNGNPSCAKFSDDWKKILI